MKSQKKKTKNLIIRDFLQLKISKVGICNWICIVSKFENRSVFGNKSNSVIEDKSMNTTINFDSIKTHPKLTANPDRIEIIKQGVFSTRNILLTTDELIANDISLFSATSRGNFDSVSPSKRKSYKHTRTMKSRKDINDKLKKIQSNESTMNELYNVRIVGFIHMF